MLAWRSQNYYSAPFKLSAGLSPMTRLERIGDDLKSLGGLSFKSSADPLVVFVSHGTHVISIGGHSSKICFLVIVLHDSALMKSEFANSAWVPFAEHRKLPFMLVEFPIFSLFYGKLEDVKIGAHL